MRASFEDERAIFLGVRSASASSFSSRVASSYDGDTISNAGSNANSYDGYEEDGDFSKKFDFDHLNKKFDFDFDYEDDEFEPYFLYQQKQRQNQQRRCLFCLPTPRFFWSRKTRRVGRRLLLSALKCALFVAAALLVLVPFLLPSFAHPPAHYAEMQQRCKIPGANKNATLYNGCANPDNEKVFISISLYDPQGDLAGGRWGQALVELIHQLGANNTFLSLYENGSGEEGARGLQVLREMVPCEYDIVDDGDLTSNDTSSPGIVNLESFPNITLPDGSVRHKRIAYLSELRNRALRPLDSPEMVNNVKFDKVLFLNDVAFHPLDAAQLLFSTNQDPESGKADYLAACAMDWKRPFTFYDVFAQRDADGYGNGLPYYPVFSGAGSGRSRADMLAESDAVRVKSCWGGMVAVKAEYVQNNGKQTLPGDFQDMGAHVVDPVEPKAIDTPVRFRHEPELYYDACECCLFCADLATAAATSAVTSAIPKQLAGTMDDKPTSKRISQTADVSSIASTSPSSTSPPLIYVNPYIRVTYGFWRLPMVSLLWNWEKLFVIPQTFFTPLFGLPAHNPYRNVQPGEPFVEEIWDRSANSWKMEPRTGRSGLFCGLREMQLLKEGPRSGHKNWVRADVPPGQSLYFPPDQ